MQEPGLMFLPLIVAILALIPPSEVRAQKSQLVTVFGATGGVGQLLCDQLVRSGCRVRAVTRYPESATGFQLLSDCEVVKADAREPSSLPAVLADTDSVVISVGTTAFPTAKWRNGNTPEAACLQTVSNILEAIPTKKRPAKIALLSSIGVERVDQFPFKILNAYGVLDAKRQSEDLVRRYCAEYGSTAIVVRPGRLVGAPFTNFDLARLLRLSQGSNRGILLDREDSLGGDAERADVASLVRRLLLTPLRGKELTVSMINSPGSPPSEEDWTSMIGSLDRP